MGKIESWLNNRRIDDYDSYKSVVISMLVTVLHWNRSGGDGVDLNKITLSYYNDKRPPYECANYIFELTQSQGKE